MDDGGQPHPELLLSRYARRRLVRSGLRVAQIPGTGPGGAVTDEDVYRATEGAATETRAADLVVRGVPTTPRPPTTHGSAPFEPPPFEAAPVPAATPPDGAPQPTPATPVRPPDGDRHPEDLGVPMSRQEELNRLIANVRRQIPELNGVMIASVDGLSIAYDFPEAEAEKVAAMAATALGLGKRISERTNLGDLAEAVIRGDRGYLVVYSAGENAVLVLSGPTNSNLGLMRIEARAASAQISQALR